MYIYSLILHFLLRPPSLPPWEGVPPSLPLSLPPHLRHSTVLSICLSLFFFLPLFICSFRNFLFRTLSASPSISHFLYPSLSSPSLPPSLPLPLSLLPSLPLSLPPSVRPSLPKREGEERKEEDCERAGGACMREKEERTGGDGADSRGSGWQPGWGRGRG